MVPYTVKLGDRAQKCKYSANSTTHNSLNKLIKDFGKDEFEGFIYPVNQTPNTTPLRVTFEDLIYDTNISNGIPCNLYIYKSTLDCKDLTTRKRTIFPLACKLRSVDTPTNKKLTQNEGQMALTVMGDIHIKNLFAEVFFIGRIECPVVTYEIIGMQEMSSIFPFDKTCYTTACSLLKQLHSHGYVHGDPHKRNFMIEAVGTSPKINDMNMKFIDMDRMEKLPIGKTYLANYMMIRDLLLLVLHANIYCAYWDMTALKRKKMFSTIYMEKNINKDTQQIESVIYPCWDPYEDFNDSIHDVDANIYYYIDHKKFLEKQTLDSIYAQFEALFADETQFKEYHEMYRKKYDTL